MRPVIIACLTLLLLSCGKKEKEVVVADEPAGQNVPADSAAVNAEASFRYQIIEAPEKTFGYDVYKNDALFIHQPHIPGMPGVKGFEKEAQATRAAELMIEKMKQGIVPPTLSEEEIAAILKN